MIRPQILRHLPGIRRLIVPLLLKPDGKGFHRFRRILLSNCRHQRRIITPAQKTAQRHIRNHPGSHSALQKPLQLSLRLIKILNRPLLHPMIHPSDIPIFPLLHFALMKPQHTSRLQLINILKNTIRRIDILLIQKPGKHIPANLLPESRTSHQRLQLRPKDQITALNPIIQRLLPDPVPHQKNLFRPPVIQSDGKHPVHPVNTGNTPFQVSCDNHLRITVRLKGVVRKFLLQFTEIINLTIKNHTHTLPCHTKSSLRMHRLMPQLRKIHDRKPALRKSNPVPISPDINLRPGIIRPPVIHRIIHPPQSLQRNIPPANKPANPAHPPSLPSKPNSSSHINH